MLLTASRDYKAALGIWLVLHFPQPLSLYLNRKSQARKYWTGIGIILPSTLIILADSIG